MRPLFSVFVFAGVLLGGDLPAAEPPAAGKLLVASRELQGPTFAETVVLLVHYDDDGAVGLIVNRPMSITPAIALPRLPMLADYRGPLYLGGPVDRRRILALQRSKQPRDTAAMVFGDVYVRPLDEALLAEPLGDSSRLRLYVGYAGWGPGQLDEELARGSWHVASASEELVFSDAPDTVWRRLLPPPTYQASPGSFLPAVKVAETRRPGD